MHLLNALLLVSITLFQAVCGKSTVFQTSVTVTESSCRFFPSLQPSKDRTDFSPHTAPPFTSCDAFTALGSYVVSKTPQDCEFGSVSAAIAALPDDGLDKRIFVNPGQYNEQISITRNGKVTLRGFTNFSRDYTQNQVTIFFDYGVNTSAGQDESTPVIKVKESDTLGIAIYNINFNNTFVQTKDFAALASDFDGPNIAAYGCAFYGFQDTVLLNKGTQVLSNCYIEGSKSTIILDRSLPPPSTAVKEASITTSTVTSAPLSTATHPSSGNSPPPGALLVASDSPVKGAYHSLSDALASLPNDATPQTIFIYPGNYIEQFNINRPGPVTVIGFSQGNPGQTYEDNTVEIRYSRGLSVVAPIPSGHHDQETAVLTTTSNQISFYNINFINTDNLDGATPSYVTLAGSTYGDKIALYGCSLVGWQDTLLTGSTTGYQYYESCYIEGAIDFIWGYSAAYFKGCVVGAKRATSAITAQSRASSTATGGYVFDQCLFTQAKDQKTNLDKTVYLGRPYSAFAKVVIKGSYLDTVVNPFGWKPWSVADPRTSNVTFVEYHNGGPGNWENNAAAREAIGFATLATEDNYPFSGFFAAEGTDWIDLTFFSSIVTPTKADIDFSQYITSTVLSATTVASAASSSSFTTRTTVVTSSVTGSSSAGLSTTAPAPTESTFSSTPSTTSTRAVTCTTCFSTILSTTTSAPAATSTEPSSQFPQPGDYVVSQQPIDRPGVYSTLQKAVAALPNDNTSVNLFIYGGVYNVTQILLTRPGATTFRGYSDTPSSYGANVVTIQNDQGVNTQANQSNSDSATLFSQSSLVSLYNINLVNAFGQTPNFASLAFASGGNGDAAFYNSQIRGNQDTLDVASGTNIFASGTYVEGSVDFIWNAGSIYLLGCDIAPNIQGSTITAMKRDSASASGGAVFDQCNVFAANGSDIPDGSVFLGRLYNNFSRVAYIESNLGAIISPAGWEVWQPSDPRTSNVEYAEYHNTGPGAVRGERVSFSHEATDSEVVQFELRNFLSSTAWIDFDAVTKTPFPPASKVRARGRGRRVRW